MSMADDCCLSSKSGSHRRTATLQVVRYFGAGPAEGDGEEQHITTTEEGLEKLAGQHQLLGFRLLPEVMEFVLDVGAEIDFDEYG
jgi:hypothetical protein